MKKKTRAIIQFFIMAIIGIFLFTVIKHTIPAIIVVILSLVILISGLFFSSIFIKIEEFGKKIGKWTGIGITWLLLVPLFYVIFLLGRLILVILKKDLLDCKFPSISKTCWTSKKEKNKSKDCYRRLF